MESAAICEDRLQTICREGVLVGLLLHEGDVETRGDTLERGSTPRLGTICYVEIGC